MANRYITLTSDDDPITIGGRYAVIMSEPGMTKVKSKSTSREKTVGGGLDVGMGGVFDVFMYMVRVREDETDPLYGDLQSLEDLFALNNPNGDPSNGLLLTDHYGNNHVVYMLDDMSIKPLTVVIEGEHAYFYIPIVLTKDPLIT